MKIKKRILNFTPLRFIVLGLLRTQTTPMDFEALFEFCGPQNANIC